MHIKYAWDEAKRRQNREKHGLDFTEAEHFDWSTAVTREDTRTDYGERRFISTGLIGARVHVLTFTPRAGRIRVIGLRKANSRERKRYVEAQELH